MRFAELRQRFIAVRLNSLGEEVSCISERRIRVLLAARWATERRLFWARGVWRAAVSRVAATVAYGAVSLFTPVGLGNGNKLSQDFENTLLCSLGHGGATP